MTKHKPKMFGGLILSVIFDKYIVRNKYKVYLNLSFFCQQIYHLVSIDMNNLISSSQKKKTISFGLQLIHSGYIKLGA